MKMSLVLSSCVPVASGIISVFMGTFLGAFAPATGASPPLISMENRGNLTIRYLCKIGSFTNLFLFSYAGVVVPGKRERY